MSTPKMSTPKMSTLRMSTSQNVNYQNVNSQNVNPQNVNFPKCQLPKCQLLIVSYVCLTSYNRLHTVFSLKYQTAKNNSKWECPENFRELLLKCPVWTREFYSASFSSWFCEFLCPILPPSVCVGQDPRRHILSITFEVVKPSDRSHGRCRSPWS